MQHLDPGDAKGNTVPVPKGLPPVAAAPGDDWTQFGHDALRSFVSKEAIDLPFTVAWTWKPEAPAKFVANAVAAAGYVHVHCVAEGNGQGMQSGFRNPWLVTLGAMTGEYRGGFTPQKDVTQGNWLAVFEDFNVLYIDDALGAYDCRTFSDKRWKALDRWGPLAVDHQLKIVLHVNNIMADADFPLVEAHKLSGSSLWQNNIWKIKKGEGIISVHEVNVNQGICLCALRYEQAPGPKDGIYAWEWQKGGQLWLVEGKFRSVVSGAKRAYVVDDAGEVRALELRTGKELWKATFGGPLVSSPGLWKDRLVALTKRGELIAMGAEEKEDGKTLWTAAVDGAQTAEPRVEGVGGASGNDRSSIVLSDSGRALVCLKGGLAVRDLADGKEIGRWMADGAVAEMLKDGPVCPILARGTIVLCGKSAVVALWTGGFLKENAAVVLKQADALSKSGKTAEAIRIALAVAGVEGIKDDAKKKAEAALAAVNKLGEKEYTDVPKLEEKGHLFKAKSLCDDLATRFAGADAGKKAADKSAALAKKLEDPAAASEAGFKEAQSLESAGKRKEAAQGYKAVMEKYPDTEFGKKAADAYQKVKSYDK
ncbi:MAG: hypothetical protein FD180_2722 [Planctomycetota bacterium]|nr:MAG: hypothetical protein FD180_2722 [Planctomycetota bacterium]